MKNKLVAIGSRTLLITMQHLCNGDALSLHGK